MTTVSELREEWEYRFQERLGMICGTAQPTEAEIEQAKREADTSIADLVRQN